MTSRNENPFLVTSPQRNPPAVGGFPSQRAVKADFDVFFDVSLKNIVE